MNRHGADVASYFAVAAAWLWAQFTADPFGTYALLAACILATIRLVIGVADLIARFKAKRKRDDE